MSIDTQQITRRQVLQGVTGLLLTARPYSALAQSVEATIADGNCLALSSDGVLLAVPIKGKGVAIFDYARGEMVRLLPVPAEVSIQSLAFAGKGSKIAGLALGAKTPLVAAGCSDGIVRLWNGLNGDAEGKIEAHQKAVTGMVFSPDGNLLATISKYETRLKLWNPGAKTLINEVPGLAVSMDSIAIAPDGKTIALGGVSAAAAIHLYNVADPAVVRRFSAALRGDQRLSITALDFSPDGKRLASGSLDNTACVWDLETQKVLSVFHGHTGPVISVAFRPSGRLIASAGVDKSVKLWLAATGEESSIHIKGPGEVYAMKFAPDGKSLVCIGQSGLARVQLPAEKTIE